MKPAAAQKLLRTIADRLDEPEFASRIRAGRALDAQLLDTQGHIWTVSVHEVCPDELAAQAELVTLNNRPVNTDGRLN